MFTFTVVNKFTCSRCNSTYVIMTNRHIRASAYENVDIFPLTGANVQTTSLVHDHYILTGHAISFHDFIYYVSS